MKMARYDDLIEKYENTIEHACDLKMWQVFIANGWQKPDGLCDSAWGMAANMIGVKKRIICFDNNGVYMTMFNPEIVKFSEPYETEEGCRSLLGGLRKTKRYKKVKVQYQTADFKVRTKTFAGWTAQIIQHEIDHCNGILI